MYDKESNIVTPSDAKPAQDMFTHDEHENHRLVMLRYEGTYMGLGPDTIESMKWQVVNDKEGFVDLTTTEELTDAQTKSLNRWFNKLKMGDMDLKFSPEGFVDPTERHTYETDMTFTGLLSPEQRARIESFDATASMKKYIHDKNWNDISKSFADVREATSSLTSAKWDVTTGKVRIETEGTPSVDQMTHLSNWIHDINHREVYFGDMPIKESDYKLTDVNEEVTTEETKYDLNLTESDLSFGNKREKALAL